jgi:(S)-2-hydroxyglutarate dehydrogenase
MPSTSQSADVIVIGGGIIGLATALSILRASAGVSVAVIEKEDSVGQHQTGHNSGVIHSGIYYRPGSLKAELSRRGGALMREFAADHGIPVDRRGKLLVAADPLELARLQALRERAAVNGIKVDYLDQHELRRWEPNVVGHGALHVSETSIIDYGYVAEVLADLLKDAGCLIKTGHEVTSISESSGSVAVTTAHETHRARFVVACAGLQSDRLARMAGAKVGIQIVPFRGEYFRVAPEKASLITKLIYPVPDPNLPFLGIHITPTIDGVLTVGPNAVLGLAREGYRRGKVVWRDVAEYAAFPGMWRMGWHHKGVGLRELGNSLWRRAYLRACRKYCPTLSVEDLLPHPAGIRAQAVARDGSLVEDFLIEQTDRSIHVLNAPSPAATSSLALGDLIAKRVVAKMHR